MGPADSLALHSLFERGEDNFHVAEEGHVFDVFNIVLEFLFPSDGVAAIHLSKAAEARTHVMAMFLLGIVARQILDQKWPRPDYSHIAFKDVEQFWEFVETRAAEELSISSQAFVIWQKFAIRIFFAGHGAELDELEDFFVFTRTRLRKEGVALHFNCSKDGEYDEHRAKAKNCRECTEEVQRTLEVTRVHQANTSLDPSLRSG